MRILKTGLNIILAVILVTLSVALMVLGYGISASSNWETVGLDEGSSAGRWMWLDGEPIFYRTWGSDEDAPLVLVHGVDQGGAAVWEELAPRLSRYGYYVIALDLPGFGHSTRSPKMDYTLDGQANMLATVLNEMSAQDAYIVTHGWGSAVALSVASEQPQFAQALVFINPEGAMDISSIERWCADIPYLGRSVVWLRRGGGPLHELLLRRSTVGRSKALDAYIADARQASHMVGSNHAWLLLYGVSGHVELPQQRVAQQPITVVIPVPEQDETESPVVLNLPGGTTQITVRGGGAWLPLEMPGELAAQIAQTLAEGQ